MARAKVKLNLRGIRDMKGSIDDGFLQGVAEDVAAKARAAGEAVAHGGNYPVHTMVVPRPVAGKAAIVICPVPWAMAIEAKHGVLAKALG